MRDSARAVSPESASTRGDVIIIVPAKSAAVRAAADAIADLTCFSVIRQSFLPGVVDTHCLSRDLVYNPFFACYTLAAPGLLIRSYEPPFGRMKPKVSHKRTGRSVHFCSGSAPYFADDGNEFPLDSQRNASSTSVKMLISKRLDLMVRRFVRLRKKP